jgi:hypothetical protein
MTPREAIQRVILALLKPAVRTGLAINIDLDKGTCDVDLQNGAYLHEVKLQAIAPMGSASAVKGLLVVPADKSVVQATMLEGMEENWVLVQYSNIANVYINTGGGTVELNGHDYGGLVMVQKLVEKINALEVAMNTHTHPYVNVAAPATTSVTTQQINPETQVADLENTRVKHGSAA